MTDVLPRHSASAALLKGYGSPNNESKLTHSQSLDFSKAYDTHSGKVIWNAEAQGMNKKLMRLAVDSRTSTKRQSRMYDESTPTTKPSSLIIKDKDKRAEQVENLKIRLLTEDENTRFPRIEEMSHFHYSVLEFDGAVTVSLCLDENEDVTTLDTGQGFLVQVNSGDKSWVVKRSQEDFVGLDRQIHRCLYDRRYSQLPHLKEFEIGSNLTEEMVQQMECYLSRFTELAGNNVNCGPILNWLELDNHGNHLVVMEADDSAINVPAVAAGRVIKRYQAQAVDEMTLEVGDFLSVIDMPPTDETIWWRGKKGYEVGFFPSHCVEILGDKESNDRIIGHLQSRAIAKRRGKFISFLRFFFKSRPSKDELMHSGILRERIFGCDLGERLAKTGRDVPAVLELCAKVIEEHGIVDGIYRLSGILSNLQSLRIAFDADGEPPELTNIRYLHDIHCISSLLKTYFRELPNPLFTHELYDKFVAAIGKVDDTEKTVAFHHVIQRLPPPHYRTMNYLLRHLNLVASHAGETNMTAKNLAIVWAPNLLRPNLEDSAAALTEFRTQAIIVEYMIRNVNVFFDKNLASAAIAYYPEVQETAPAIDSTAIARAVSTNTGPKLITLEEARQRHQSSSAQHRKVSETVSTASTASNSPRHSKIRSSVVPPKVAATPISPNPKLLSLEEALSRTQPKGEVKANVTTVQQPPRRGSADLVEMKNGGVNSPKRSKKWFGLFTNKSKDLSEDEGLTKAQISHPTIIKKENSPKRSQSEYRINEKPGQGLGPRTSSVGVGMKDHSSSEFGERISPNSDDEWRYKSSDGDDSSLMSAVQSVQAKYFNLNDRKSSVKSVDVNNKAEKSSSRKTSFTIGEPQGFRRLDDNELQFLPPKNVFISKDLPVLEKTKEPPATTSSSAQLVRDFKDRKSVRDTESHKQTVGSTNQIIVLSPERKHHRQASEENVPIKKVRSMSPENYTKTTRESREKIEANRPEQPVDSFRVKHSQQQEMSHKNTDSIPSYQNIQGPNSSYANVTGPQQKHVRSLSTPSEDQEFQVKSNFKFERHASSLYNPRKATSPSYNDNRLRRDVFAIRRLRSHSEDEQRLDSLVQHTESKIKAGNPEALAIPRRDYCNDIPQQHHNNLIESTEKRMNGDFVNKPNTEGYILKQRRIAGTSLTLTNYEIDTEKDIRTDNGNSEMRTSKHSVDNTTQQKQDYINVENNMKTNADATKTSANDVIKSPQQSRSSESNTRTDAFRTRTRSVKERAALFDTKQTVELRTPPTTRRHEKTRSSPEINIRNEQIKSVDHAPRDQSRSYVNLSNRHSSYVPSNTQTSSVNRYTPVGTSRSKGDLGTSNSRPGRELDVQRTPLGPAVPNGARATSPPRQERQHGTTSSTDKLVASSIDRTTNDTKPPFMRKQDHNKRHDNRRPKSEHFDQKHVRYDSADSADSSYEQRKSRSPRPKSIGYSSMDLHEQFQRPKSGAYSTTDVRVEQNKQDSHRPYSNARSTTDLRKQPPPYSHRPQTVHSTAEFSHNQQRSVNYQNRPKSAVSSHTDLRSVNYSPKPRALYTNIEHGSDYSIKSVDSVFNYDMRRSVSDNRLTSDASSSPVNRQIGRFPLTLRSGSNSRSNVLNSKQSNSRPLSMYDNHRGSYYDNVHNIHYEML